MYRIWNNININIKKAYSNTLHHCTDISPPSLLPGLMPSGWIPDCLTGGDGSAGEKQYPFIVLTFTDRELLIEGGHTLLLSCLCVDCSSCGTNLHNYVNGTNQLSTEGKREEAGKGKGWKEDDVKEQGRLWISEDKSFKVGGIKGLDSLIGLIDWNNWSGPNLC